MKVLQYTGREDIAMVYIARMDNSRLVEFIESRQPPLPLKEKWVIIVSTLFGCPVGCPICDAGNFYKGKLTANEIFEQIDFLVGKRFPDRNVAVKKFKIQFARMGEPSFNPNVLKVLKSLPSKYNAPGMMPCISTIAPSGTDKFFDELIEIKDDLYKGKFQLQFSIHTTDIELRDRLIPVKKWDFAKIAGYGKRFYKTGDRKITLNFALERKSELDPKILHQYFDPDKFLIKVTPLNPTYKAAQNRLSSHIDPCQQQSGDEIAGKLQEYGYEVIISIGEATENYIGSNCGQYVMSHSKEKGAIPDGYTYTLKDYTLKKHNNTT